METLKKILPDDEKYQTKLSEAPNRHKFLKAVFFIFILSGILFMAACSAGSSPTSAHRKPPVVDRH